MLGKPKGLCVSTCPTPLEQSLTTLQVKLRHNIDHHFRHLRSRSNFDDPDMIVCIAPLFIPCISVNISARTLNLNPNHVCMSALVNSGGLLYIRTGANTQYVTASSFLIAVYGDSLAAVNHTLQCDSSVFTPQDLWKQSRSQVHIKINVSDP